MWSSSTKADVGEMREGEGGGEILVVFYSGGCGRSRITVQGEKGDVREC